MHADFKPTTLNDKLSHVTEECGEVLAAIGKTQRFGLRNTNPLLPEDQQETNVEWLRRELADLQLSIEALLFALRNH